jgi:hypothetical protein
MNQTFSLFRFRHLLRLQWTLYGKRYLLGILTGTLVYSIILTFLLTSLPEIVKSRQLGGWFLFHYSIIGLLLLNMAINWLNNKSEEIAFLMVPISTFEKYLYFGAFRLIVFPVVLIPIWFYILVIITFFNHRTYLPSSSANIDFPYFLDIFNFKGATFSMISFVVFLQILIFSLWIFKLRFSKMIFLKWLLTFALMLLGVILFNMYNGSPYVESLLFWLPFYYYGIPFLILLMLLGYFSLKEKHV